MLAIQSKSSIMTQDRNPSKFEFHPLTKERWSDFVALFGKRGAYGGCWCMWWRETRSEFDRNQGDGNQALMKEIVISGKVPGILAYIDGQPAGWCSVAPRQDYGSLNRSRVLKPIDDEPVWSIVCFFVVKSFRGMSLSEKLIKAAVTYVAENGGRILEAYPTVPRGKRLSTISTFMGFPAVFEQAGFIQVARPSEARMIMRYYIDDLEVD
jgi:GNAT superfamily N-acetyltransferase